MIDNCIYDEVISLWEAGIQTSGCCCGHNIVAGFISVWPEYTTAMIELGYTQQEKEDHFNPKSIKQ